MVFQSGKYLTFRTLTHFNTFGTRDDFGREKLFRISKITPTRTFAFDKFSPAFDTATSIVRDDMWEDNFRGENIRMGRKFNDTGLCVPERHYIVDTSRKIDQIMQLVEDGEYFTINRPRQFGKTTTLSLLFKALKQREDYLPFKISFEGVGDAMFADEHAFCPALLRRIGHSFLVTNPELLEFFTAEAKRVQNFEDLSQWISRYVMHTQKHVVLLIDEVDQSSNNQIFLYFIGMLREKYLKRNEGEDYTFQSVILAGVYDVKTLTLKIRPDAEQKLNGPWNIAVDFTVDLSFQPDEIATMLRDYQQDKQVAMNVPAVADRLYYYTSGYPYLVSKLCKFIDEVIVPERDNPNWSVSDVEAAFRLIARESYSTTLFDSLAKNLENDPDLYDLVFQIVMNGARLTFTTTNTVMHRAHLYGILAESDGVCVVHNRIYEQKIYAHMLSKTMLAQGGGHFPSSEFFFKTFFIENIIIIFQS